MSEQEIIEGNKLITKFLYENLYEDDGIDSWVEESGKVLFYLEDAKYHSSWDWLMSVVSKIGKMYEDLVKNAYKTKTTISYDIDSTYADVICRNVTIDIGHLFERVVAFIKWYNTCQKN